MDNNKFLGESGLNQLITNVHDVTFKEISYDDYMALPEEERNIGRYAVRDWPDESGVKSKVLVKTATLRFDISTANIKPAGEISFDIVEGNADLVVNNSDIKVTAGNTYIITATAQTDTSYTLYLSLMERNTNTILKMLGTDGEYQPITLTYVMKCTEDNRIFLKTEDGSTREKCTSLSVIELSEVTASTKSNMHTYSTEEQVVGTWIDGKPVYERVIIFNDYTIKRGTNEFIHEIENIDTAINMDHSFVYNDILYKHWDHQIIQELFDKEKITIRYDNQLDPLLTKYYKIIVQYTKTTD